MNILPSAKRREIVGLWAAGATISEIAAAVGCAKKTVSLHLGDFSGRRRLRMAKLIDDVMDWVDERTGVDGAWSDCDALSELNMMTRFQCPIHQEVDWDTMCDTNGRCPECKADGMRRMHARLKASRNAPGVDGPPTAGQ